MSERVGIVLSNSTTREAYAQLLEQAEGGNIREGMLLVVGSDDLNRRILARVAEVRHESTFYKQNDAWSEARRKDKPIPSSIARQSENCVLDLLKQLPIGDIVYPPLPGDSIFLMDPKKHAKEMFGADIGDCGIVWLGSLAGYEKAPVAFNVENLPMHMAIFGVTGSGKSFGAGGFLENLCKIPFDQANALPYPMLIIDAHGDYTNYPEYFMEKGKLGALGWAKKFIFPISYHSEPTNRVDDYIEPIGINLDNLPSREVAELVIHFYRGEGQISELQVSGLEKQLHDLKHVHGHLIQELFSSNISILEESIKEDKEIHQATRPAILRAISKFHEEMETRHMLLSTLSSLKQKTFVEEITTQGGLVVVDFSADGAPGVDLPTKQFVISYLASLLFKEFTEFKVRNEQKFLLFVIEEAQNFCPSSSYHVGSSLAHQKLAAIATQGRKFGLSLCLISQRPSFLDPVVLSMCNTFLIFRISPEDVRFVRSVTGGLPASLSEKLTNLSRGEFILNGQMSKTDFPLLVTVLESDRTVPHLAGTTNVMERLAEIRGIQRNE